MKEDNSTVVIGMFQNTEKFKESTTFCAKSGLASVVGHQLFSFESVQNKHHYFHFVFGAIVVNPFQATSIYMVTASWILAETQVSSVFFWVNYKRNGSISYASDTPFIRSSSVT